MRLTRWEEERLLIFAAAELARRHRAAGILLNAPEAVAVICDAMLEAARAGASYAEVEHVHLGFPAGVLIDDRRRVMSGAGITKRARWLTYGFGDPVDAGIATELVLAAEAVARLPRGALA